MRKLALSILLVFLSQILIHAQSHQVFTSKITPEYIFIGKDTLLIINFNKSVKAEFYESEIQASFLLRKKTGKIDTLLSKIPENTNFEITHDFVAPLKFDLNETIYEFLNGHKSYDDDDTKYQYSSTVNIEYLSEGIFQISHSDSEYTGGIHGYGNEFDEYYDYETNKLFEFNDIFEPEAKKIIYSYFIEEIGLDKSQTNFEDFPDHFTLTKESIDFACGMYGSMFGYGGNYQGCFLSVPYSKLKRDVIRNSPIERLIK